MPDLKICKHCRWYNPGLASFAQCRAPQNTKVLNLVTGEQEYTTIYCSTHRDPLNPESAALCGVKAQWFEFKEVPF